MSIKVNFEKNYFSKCHAHKEKKGRGSYNRKKEKRNLKNDLKDMKIDI